MIKPFEKVKLNKLLVMLLLLFTMVQTGVALHCPTCTADAGNPNVMTENISYMPCAEMQTLCAGTHAGITFPQSAWYPAKVAFSPLNSAGHYPATHTPALSNQFITNFMILSPITLIRDGISQLQSILSKYFGVMIPVPFVIITGLFIAYTRHPLMTVIVLTAAVAATIAAILLLKALSSLIEWVQDRRDKNNGKAAHLFR